MSIPLSDSFDAVSSINDIPNQLHLDGYQFVSFDVESLFTNALLSTTVNIVFNRVFDKNVINTTLSKPSLKNLFLDCCSKTTFSFDNQLYEQVDGVSMDSSLAPV